LVDAAAVEVERADGRDVPSWCAARLPHPSKLDVAEIEREVRAALIEREFLRHSAGSRSSFRLKCASECCCQDNQLMSKHRVLSKPQLRLEWRGQDGQNETEQPNHSASLGDSITSSARIRFSVHTAASKVLLAAR
jgi:hypothetical protein